jgi:hypothetical protein
VLRFSIGQEALTNGPTVRQAYVVIDVVLLLFGGVVVVEAVRIRGWRRRVTRALRPRLALLPSLLLDVALPLAILVGVPLWVGTTGTARPLDVIGTWAVALWTLPDVAASLLLLSGSLLLIGISKVALLRSPEHVRPIGARDPAIAVP